jgi:hypothetical protein
MATITGTNVNFVKVSTKSQYDDLIKQDGTIYFVVSEKKIYLDGVGYGLSDDDANKFLHKTGGTVTGVTNFTNKIKTDLIQGISEKVTIDLEDKQDYPNLEISSTGAGQIEIRDFDYLQVHTILNMNNNRLTGVADPTQPYDAINKAFLEEKITDLLDTKGAAGGIASLDASGKVPSSQLPSYVDDVIEAANQVSFPQPGEAGKIYVSLDNNKTWRWSGSGYTEISASLTLGETSSTAYYGDRGKAAYDHSQLTGTNDNPHNITKAKVGLGSVQNYGLATEAQAKAGAVNNVYMTPQRTKQAIEELAPRLTWEVVS